MRVTLFDVTNPWLAGNQELAARTLEDDAGNRYVLLTVARYLDLLQHAR